MRCSSRIRSSSVCLRSRTRTLPERARAVRHGARRAPRGESPCRGATDPRVMLALLDAVRETCERSRERLIVCEIPRDIPFDVAAVALRGQRLPRGGLHRGLRARWRWAPTLGATGRRVERALMLTSRQLPRARRERAAAAAVGSGLYTWQVEPFWLDLVRRPMPLENLPAELVGKTLLQISDIHVGPKVSSDYLIRSFREARATSLPTSSPSPATSSRTATDHEIKASSRACCAARPAGRLGSVAALGNHDYGRSWRHIDVADHVSRVAATLGSRCFATTSPPSAAFSSPGSPTTGARSSVQNFGMRRAAAMRQPVSSAIAQPGRRCASAALACSHPIFPRSCWRTTRTCRTCPSGTACAAGCSPVTRTAAR